MSCARRAPELARLEEQLNDLPVVRLLGVSLEIGGDGLAQARLAEARPIHRGGLGSEAINGMTLMGLADAVMCSAVLATEGVRRCATLGLQARFLRPAATTPLQAQGTIDERGSDIFACSARVVDGRGRVCLEASARIRIFKKGDLHAAGITHTVHAVSR